MLIYYIYEIGFCQEPGNCVEVPHPIGPIDSSMTLKYYSPMSPDDLKESISAIDNTGTAMILLQIYDSEGQKGLLSQAL